jgi:hypothetical protein
VLNQVAEFMDDHVLDTHLWGDDQIGVEKDSPFLLRSPSPFLLPGSCSLVTISVMLH